MLDVRIHLKAQKVSKSTVFQQDEAHSYSTLTTRSLLDEMFPKSFERYAPTCWPARWPDLTPLDVFF